MKAIILGVAFIIFTLFMFFYGYGIMGARNQQLADTIAQRNVELEVLQREQKSFEQGKKDLAILDKSQYRPSDLFNSDTKVVKEIQQLESAAQRYGVDLKISVSGSVKDAKKLEGKNSELYAIPYVVNLKGPIDNTLMFIQSLERMPFASYAHNLTMHVVEDDIVMTTITSEFYIKK
jgi:hypothetical protein